MRHKTGDGLHVFFGHFFGKRGHGANAVAQRAEHAVGIGLDLVEHGPNLALRARRLQGVAHGARWLQGQKKLLAARQLGWVCRPAGAGKTSQRQGTSRWRQPSEENGTLEQLRPPTP